LLACIGFIICFLIVYFTPNIQILKPLILLGLFFALVIDSCFTIIPLLHNKNITL